MVSTFIHIYNYLKKHKTLLYILCVSIFALLSIVAYNIKFEEDIYGFMPNDENRKRINFVNKNIGFADKIILRISQVDTTGNIDIDEYNEVTTRLINHLDSVAKPYIKETIYEINTVKIIELSKFVIDNMPYFLTDADYDRLDTILSDTKIATILEDDKRILVSQMGSIMSENILADPLHIAMPIISGFANFNTISGYKLINDCIFTSDGREQIAFITSKFSLGETAENAKFVELIEQSIAATKADFNGKYDIKYFGAVPISVTNANQIKQDSFLSVTISIILILVLLWYVFRSFKSMLLILIPVIFGVLFSIAVLVIVKGTVSAIAIGASSIIIGIAINYSIHFLSHGKHSESVEQLIKDVVSPLVIGNITTVAAFISLLYISADAIKDFGMFAAFMLIGTILFVLVFMPHFLGKSINRDHGAKKTNYIDKLTFYEFDSNKYLLITIVVLTIVFFVVGQSPVFDTNMHNMNYMTKEQREEFDKIRTISNNDSTSVIHYVHSGDNLNAALLHYESGNILLDSLKSNNLIHKTVGVGNLLPTDSMQIVKINRWNTFWRDRKDIVISQITDKAKVVGFRDGAFSSFTEILNKNYEVKDISYFEPIVSSFLKDYIIDKEGQAMVITSVYTDNSNTNVVRDILNNADPENAFIYDMGGIAQKLINALSDDFNYVLYVCAFIVFIFLTISFGRLELGIIAFLPLAVSWVWILGLMHVFGLSFNIINIILATFIFGQGDDYTIFMTEGKIYEYSYRRKILSSYKSAIAISFITMIIGIGTLIFAKHPAMLSLAKVTIIGMGTVVLMTYVIPSAMFNILTTIKGRRRNVPITIVNLFTTILAFTVFLFGSIVLTIYGFFILTIGGRTYNNRLRFHKALSLISKVSVYILPRVKTILHNDYGEKFSTPSIIVSNHQSHLDLVLTLMLNPKIVVLTNKWVWNSPFYGNIIRYADFYPVSDGFDQIVDKLETLVNMGYSILVFPEGTRSRNGDINRFHKGAFYLAERLNLDILPVLIHGAGTVLSKSEFLLQRGTIDVFIGQRMRDVNPKDMRQYYINWYRDISSFTQTYDYFYGVVHSNYVYKGGSVEWYIRKFFIRRKHYADLISTLPDRGTLLITNCGYGAFTLICSLIKPGLIITAYDVDCDKIDLARNCTAVPNNLKYTNTREMIDLKYDLVINLEDKD